MHLNTLDVGVIVAFIATTIFIGFWISKRASRSIQIALRAETSFRGMPLGFPMPSGMFDISGTMWLVYLLFVYGLKSLWIPWLWSAGVTFT